MTATITAAVTAPDGSPIAGVPVSDGATVVVTGADGRAVIADPRPPFVWVHRPAGWDTEDWYRRAGPGDEVRFTLAPAPDPTPVTFLQITDLHVSAAPEPARLPLPDSLYGLDADGNVVPVPLTRPDDLVAAVTSAAAGAGPDHAPAFVVATGDLTDHGTGPEFAMLAEAIERIPLPVLLLPGNHDHYGHLLEPRPDDTPVDSHGMGTGTVTRYEEHVGPRWWSCSWGDLRLVALDWFSHRLGLDRAVQEAWLAADLASAPAGTAVLFCTHDQMDRALFDRAAAAAPHVRILGSLSGHWHTSRVVEVDGQVHANTGNTTFGSFDWAPAHARLVTWDGARLRLRTVTIGASGRLTGATFRAAGDTRAVPGARWSTSLPGTAHLARPAVVEAGGTELVVVGWSDDDAPAGGVVAHDAADGRRVWQADLGAPVRAGITTADVDGSPVVLAVTINGGLAALDAASGARRWQVQVGDPLRMWVHATPAVVDGTVVAGEVRTLSACSLDDGAEVWSRSDLGHPENGLTTTRPLLVDGTLLVGFTLQPNHTLGLDPATGAVRWQRDANQLHSPTSDFVADSEGEDAYVVRLVATVERFAASSGAPRWRRRLGTAFAGGTPVLAPGALFATSAIGTVHRLDPTTGDEQWRVTLPGEGLLPMGPYRRRGLAVAAGPLAALDALWQGTGDGDVFRVDPATGAHERVAALGAPVTTVPVATSGGIVVAASDGTLAGIA